MFGSKAIVALQSGIQPTILPTGIFCGVFVHQLIGVFKYSLWLYNKSMFDKITGKDLVGTEEMFHALINSSPDCIKLFDLEGNLFYINKGGLREHRLVSVEDALEKKWQALGTIIEADKEKFTLALKDAARGKTTTIEIAHTREGSTREVCSEIIAPIEDSSGQVVAVFGISRDITEVKRIEAELMKSKEDLEKHIREQKIDLDKKIEQLNHATKLFVDCNEQCGNLKKEIEGLKK